MLSNKKIVVAGAGGLLGSVLTKYLLEAGARVIATDITCDIIKQRLNNLSFEYSSLPVDFEVLDVTSESCVKNFFNQHNDLSGAVNCSYPRNKNYGKSFFDVNYASFIDNVSLHLGSAFLFSQQSAMYFKNNLSPFSLVNIASIYGVVAPKFNIYEGTSMTMPVEYAAIKAAILHLDKYISSYVEDSRFRINSVSPGGILDGQPESFQKAYKKQTNGKGMLHLDDVMGSIIFLLSDSSSYVSGQNIIVDDGFVL